MRKWEDIFKDKLEETKDSLPEGVFAEFQARLDEVEAIPKGKRFPLGWVIAATAVAAGLAAVLFLRQPATSEDGIQIVLQTSAPVAHAPESNEVTDPILNESLTTHPITLNHVRSRSLMAYSQVTDSCEIEEIEETAVKPVEKSEIQEDAVPVKAAPQEETVADDPIPPTNSPFFLDKKMNKPIWTRNGTSSNLIMGSGLIAAVITPMFVKSETRIAGYPIINGSEENRTHYLPMRVGFSTSFALSDRLNLTTGLEYLLFSSRFSKDSSEGTKQFVHYLGVPVRLDWTLVSHNGLDLYVGGGFAGDYCLTASLGGNLIEKDGLGLSLLGASGIQYHITDRVGIFVEPEISWTIPSESRKLDTYRSEHPIMFTFATGLRLNIRKK